MSQKKRVKRLEEKLNLNGREKRVIIMTYAPPRDVKPDIEDFPYKNKEDCKSYQRQIKELERKDPDREVWFVTLDCKRCKEDCKFTDMVIGIGKEKK